MSLIMYLIEFYSNIEHVVLLQERDRLGFIECPKSIAS